MVMLFYMPKDNESEAEMILQCLVLGGIC